MITKIEVKNSKKKIVKKVEKKGKEGSKDKRKILWKKLMKKLRKKIKKWFEKKDEKKDEKKEKREILNASRFLFNRVVEGEKDNVMFRLVCMFRGLRYEDLEEVYFDGCLVLWNKMNEKGFKLKEESIVGYLFKVCRNIGMHYLRKVNRDVESLDMILERGCEKEYNDDGMKEFFDVMDEGGEEDEIYEKLDKAWGKLKEVDRMILDSYYVDGCKMSEIAKRVGYKNGNSVKSRKNKVLKKIMVLMEKRA